MVVGLKGTESILRYSTKMKTTEISNFFVHQRKRLCLFKLFVQATTDIYIKKAFFSLNLLNLFALI